MPWCAGEAAALVTVHPSPASLFNLRSAPPPTTSIYPDLSQFGGLGLTPPALRSPFSGNRCRRLISLPSGGNRSAVLSPTGAIPVALLALPLGIGVPGCGR